MKKELLESGIQAFRGLRLTNRSLRARVKELEHGHYFSQRVGELEGELKEAHEALEGRATELGYSRARVRELQNVVCERKSEINGLERELAFLRARVRVLADGASRRTSAYDQGYRDASEALDPPESAFSQGDLDRFMSRQKTAELEDRLRAWVKELEEAHEALKGAGPRSAYGRVMELKTWQAVKAFFNDPPGKG